MVITRPVPPATTYSKNRSGVIVFLFLVFDWPRLITLGTVIKDGDTGILGIFRYEFHPAFWALAYIWCSAVHRVPPGLPRW